MITIYKKPGTLPLRDLPTGQSIYYMSGMISYQSPLYSNIWRPPADIYETEDDIVVLTEIAGMSEDGFNINIDQNSVTISGARPNPELKRVFFQMELNYGEFLIEIEVSKSIEVDQATAEYKDGFLKIRLPKSKPKQINVNRE